MSGIDSFRAEMQRHGLEYTGQIIADGRLRRFKAEGDRNRNSWYLLHAGPPCAGAFGCWKRCFKQTWCERGPKSMSDAEWREVIARWKEADEARKRDQADQQAKARATAEWILRRAEPLLDHAYLRAKRVSPTDGLFGWRGSLVVPLLDVEGAVHSLQFIATDGTKHFLRGGRVAGCMALIIGPHDRPLVISEGVATGLSVRQATGYAVVCAMNAGNLLAICKALRAKWPAREIIIAGDDDRETPGNPGATKAIEAARSVGARFALPVFKDTATNPTDFNDLHQLEGLRTVKEQIGAATTPPDETDDEKEPPQPRISAATELVKLADEFDFFHDPQSRGFVRVTVNGCPQLWLLNSSQFRKLLAQAYYKRNKSAVNRNALSDAIATLEGRALFDSPEEPVFLRVAPHGENILIDLCDPEWRVIEVTPDGWQILDRSPVAFIRTAAMRPLPVPAAEGSLEPLWGLLNVTVAQRVLVAGALLNGFHPHGPYFVVNYVGEQGSAKSCAARIHRLIIDPNETPLRSPPREERDLLVHAMNNRCVVLDNLSKLPQWLSDGLCRLATGGGHSARQLFTDGEEFSMSVKRPVILNGIEDVASRPDLAERALQIELETIPDARRIAERELWGKFESIRSVVFSGLLNGLVLALRNNDAVKLDRLPRMADAATFATAGENAFGWSTGTFMAAYGKNLDDGALASVESHPVGLAIRHLLEDQTEWRGEPTELLAALNGAASEEARRSEGWPKTPRALSACLRRLAPAFRRAGIDVEFGKGKRRSIRLCKRAEFASPASPTPAKADAKDADLRAPHGCGPQTLESESMLL